jgi:hypothetical protein
MEKQESPGACPTHRNGSGHRQIFQTLFMKLKKLGKRVLYFIGGIVIALFSSAGLSVYIEGGGQWLSTGAFMLYGAILFGVALFIVSLFPKLDEPRNTEKAPDKKTNEPGSN